MPVVGFFSKNTTIKLQNEWEKRLRMHLPSIKLVPLLSKDAEKATSALVWKAPLKRLEALNNLEYLGLQCEFTKAPDFSKFNKLKICKLQWRPKAKTVFACDSLSLLNIVNYPSEDLKDIQKMSGLRRLQLTSRKLVSLSGIESLSSLSILDLSECSKLECLSGVDMCQQVEVVEIESCKKVYDVALLGELKNLKDIVLTDCGKVKSLKPLAKCQLLESITFVGDTSVEDGELTSLLNIPTLKKMWFVDKRHYSHKREQVVEILS